LTPPNTGMGIHIGNNDSNDWTYGNEVYGTEEFWQQLFSLSIVSIVLFIILCFSLRTTFGSSSRDFWAVEEVFFTTNLPDMINI